MVKLISHAEIAQINSLFASGTVATEIGRFLGLCNSTVSKYLTHESRVEHVVVRDSIRETRRLNKNKKRALDLHNQLKANPKKFRQRDRLRRSTPLKWSMRAMGNVKGGAKRRGLECTITWEDLCRAIPFDLCCPIFLVPLKFGGVRSENTPSVDRLDGTKGYTPSNIRVISDRANRVKNDASPAEHRRIADWIENEQRNAK